MQFVRILDLTILSSKRISLFLGGWFIQVYLQIPICINGFVQVHSPRK